MEMKDDLLMLRWPHEVPGMVLTSSVTAMMIQRGKEGD